MPARATATRSGTTLPLTINEYADLHGISRTTVRKWIAQGRVPTERRGGGAERAAAILIFTTERPERLAPGSLSEDQRRAWPRKAKKEVASAARAR